MFKNFFKNKNVLITGHTGFKGSWLALWLHALGANVTGVSLPPAAHPNHFDLIELHHLIQHIEGDIRDLECVTRAFEKARPEFVFHLAAQALVRDSYDNPKITFDINVGGTVNILEAIRISSSVRTAVVITSDKCYDNKEWIWGYRENDSLGGHDPYSASKGAAEIVCAAYRRSYFDAGGMGPRRGLATARAGNVIGGGDWAKDRIIPDCVRALSQNEPIVIRHPRSTRPWQHVLDPLHGYLMLAQRLWNDPDGARGAWNFGPHVSDQITVLELAKRFVAGWGTGQMQTSPDSENRRHEAHLLHLNTDKAASDLHWNPVLDGSTAIDWTVGWYRAWHEGRDILQNVSIRQIQNFQKLACAGEQAS